MRCEALTYVSQDRTSPESKWLGWNGLMLREGFFVSAVLSLMRLRSVQSALEVLSADFLGFSIIGQKEDLGKQLK